MAQVQKIKLQRFRSLNCVIVKQLFLRTVGIFDRLLNQNKTNKYEYENKKSIFLEEISGMCFFFRYLDSASALARETNIDVSKFEVCDNIDLDTIVMEYESYYYVKFAKYPKLCKKLTQSGKLTFIGIMLMKIIREVR